MRGGRGGKLFFCPNCCVSGNLGHRGTSCFPRLLSQEHPAPWSWWRGWRRAAEQGGPCPCCQCSWCASLQAPPGLGPPGTPAPCRARSAPCPGQGDTEEKVLMSLPTINLSAWGVLKSEPLSPPPALTHVNKRFLNANKKAAAPAHQVRGPGSLGRHFTNVFFAFSGFWLVNKIEEKYSFP